MPSNTTTPSLKPESVSPEHPPELTALKRRPGRPRNAKTRLLQGADIGRHHFAFVRALLEGIDLDRAWTRYMGFTGESSDRRHAAVRLREITVAIQHAADPVGLGGPAGVAARAIRRLPDFPARRPPPRATTSRASRSDASTGSAAAPPSDAPSPALPRIPSFEAWLQAQEDPDFYSIGEWLELYKEEFGASGEPAPVAASEHARFADDQDRLEQAGTLAYPARQAAVAALNELEAALAQEPALDDPLPRWLRAGLPQDLGTVGVLTLRDLAVYANLNGYRWHRRVPRLGATRARRLIEWLGPIASKGGLPLLERARRPATDLAGLGARQEARRSAGHAPSPDIGQPPGGQASLAPAAPSLPSLPSIPLAQSHFLAQLPGSLSGQTGEFRAAGSNLWGAQTDPEAILQWLSGYRGKTQQDYSRVVDRFYRWCLLVARKPLSSLVEADIQAYQAFIANPPADWVQQLSVQRGDPDWRPFRGPLGANSQRREFAVIGSLFSAMVEKGYLRANVMANMTRTLGLVQPSINVRRSFDDRQWAFLMEVLESEPDTPHTRRLRLVLELGSTTGMRLAELTTARMKGLRREVIDGEDAWILEIVGKGGKERQVMVLDDVKNLIEAHHADMDAAGTGYREEVSRVTLPAAPKSAAGEAIVGARELGQGSGLPGGRAVGDADIAAALQADHVERWRPLVGILREPPPRRVIDALGIAQTTPAPWQADRFGALERSALYQSLRRFFRRVAKVAATREGAPSPGPFLEASTHWLRHTFANGAVEHMRIQDVQAVLGHSDLRVTSVYIKARMEDVVRGMRSLERARSGQGKEASRS